MPACARFVIFGRVPLFYYTLHVPLMHLAAVVIRQMEFDSAHWLFEAHSIMDFPAMHPPGRGFGLPGVYLIWALLICALYPLCAWFAALKRRNRASWLSYF